MVNIECYKCKTIFGLPDEHYRAALAAKGVIAFYCSYGHRQYFIEGESPEDKLRRERDRAIQQQARLEEEKREAEERAAKAERATARLKKRAAAGTCPCCTRSFTNMARHMKDKHPDWRAEAVKPALKVVS